MTDKPQIPADTLTQKVGVLTRREIEARILAPVVEALGDRFGREEVIDIVTNAIVELARQQGGDLADSMQGCDKNAFKDSLQYWTQDDALKIKVLEEDDHTLNFNVNRCRYSEMYLALGIPELGAVLSCNRDYAMIEGFNPDAQLTRTQTLMEGAGHCDFRYVFPTQEPDTKEPGISD